MKVVRSWSKPDGVPDLIARKQVDWSVLQQGATIPLEFIEDFQLANNGVRIERGQSQPVVLIHHGEHYSAALRNIDRKVPSDTFQILWSRGRKFRDLLAKVFALSLNYIEAERAAGANETGAIEVPEDKAEFIEFYRTDQPFQYEVRFVAHSDEILTRFRNYVATSPLQFSYKLVLLRAMLSTVDSDGWVDVDVIVQSFRDYYLQRIDRGLRPDDEGAVVNSIESMSSGELRRHILENPFAAYSRAGWMQRSGNRLGFSSELWATMTLAEREELWQLADKRLNDYYEERGLNASLREPLVEVLDSYLEARNQRFSGAARAYQVVTNHIPEAITASGLAPLDRYKVVGSAGQGNWAAVPWVAVMDKQITESTQSGIYIVYLFSSDMQSVYLALMLGVTELLNENPGQAGMALLREKAEAVRGGLNLTGFEWESPQLGQERLARQYEAGIIAYKKYDRGQVPDESSLRADLNRMLALYQRVASELGGDSASPVTEEVRELEIPLVQLSDKEIVTQVHQSITAQGFQYSLQDLANFYLSLRTKPFVILAGISGTGKSRLPRLFAEAISGQWHQISVRPDWNDGSDLLGYVDLAGNFRPGELTNIIKKSSSNPDIPYLVVLDEMNLARVEYYMSDLLSKMETRKLKDGQVQSERLFSASHFQEKEDSALYEGLSLPDNLYLVGTVNMDETTHPFSKKVLDRANTIEFSHVELKGYTIPSEPVPAPVKLNNNQMCGKLVRLADALAVDAPFVDSVVDKLVAINEMLYGANLQVGYRVRDEIVIYMLHNKQLELMPEDMAFDYQLSQKILPRIQGSSLPVRRLLVELLNYCGGINLSNTNDDLLDRLREHEDASGLAPYPRSSAKLITMLRRFEEDGFTSYWI